MSQLRGRFLVAFSENLNFTSLIHYSLEMFSDTIFIGLAKKHSIHHYLGTRPLTQLTTQKPEASIW